MRVTLKDIAEAAGVSTMTVSNVINGKRARVSAETVDRVRRIVAELGYVPNAPARSLAARSSLMIGLLVPAATEDSLAISPHNTAMLGHIERGLRRHGYHLLLRGVAERAEIAEALRSWSLDGALLLGFLDEEIDVLDKAVIGTTPVLAVDSYSTNPLTTGVRSDDFTGARLAAAHLLDLGHRDIVFAGPAFTDVGVVHERFLGFRAAFDDRGLSEQDCPIEVVNTTYDDGVGLARRLRSSHPGATAVFTTADILAIGLIDGLKGAGTAVPEEISVVGFDDIDVSAYITPKLTTIAQDIGGKAAVAVDRLLAKVTGQAVPDTPHVLPVRLVERASTAGPRDR